MVWVFNRGHNNFGTSVEMKELIFLLESNAVDSFGITTLVE